MIYLEKNHELFEKHKEVLTKQLKKVIKKLLEPNKSFEKFYIREKERELLICIKSRLDIFIGASIPMQKRLIKIFRREYPELTKSYAKKELQPNIYKVIDYLFVDKGYNFFTKVTKTKSYHAYTFVNALKLKTCPYCNINYIAFLEKEEDKDKIRRAELDHFFPKSVYPFLAVNFYNLIPSCSTCNKLKSDDDLYELLNPYDSKVKDIKFNFWLNNVDFLDNPKLDNTTFSDEENIKIEIKNLPQENLDTFQLERIYQAHTDMVVELILKQMHYPESYVQELANLGFSKEDIYRFVFANYLKEKEWSKRPMAKLIYDISEELGLIDNIPERGK